MSKNFWRNLKKPFFALAPMADVTDAPFRRIIAKYGAPDVMWTEFVSADGLFLGGRDILIKNLAFTDKERPVVAQFFTAKPKFMKEAAKLANELGFDGVDINMGCPDKNVEKQGAGANLIKNPKLAAELIKAAKDGAASFGRQIPVSVKTRAGYDKDELDLWLPLLLEAEPSVIIIHARTRKQLSKVSADWNFIKRAVDIRNEMKSDVLICGNGDVIDTKDARKKAEESGADGVMIGRAIFGNPWLFDKNKKNVNNKEKLKVMIEHTKLFEEITPHKNFSIMKKHYKAYVNGWDGAKKLRERLMKAENATEVENIASKYLESL